MVAAPVLALGWNTNTWRDPNFFDTTWDPAFVDAEEFITVDPDNWNRLATAGAGSVNDGVTPQSLV